MHLSLTLKRNVRWSRRMLSPGSHFEYTQTDRQTDRPLQYAYCHVVYSQRNNVTAVTLATARIATEHGSVNRIRQMAHVS